MQALRVAVLLALLVVSLSGCVLTKLITVPMRLGGAVVSVVPIAGNPVHDVIDGAAAAVDEVPL